MALFKEEDARLVTSPFQFIAVHCRYTSPPSSMQGSVDALVVVVVERGRKRGLEVDFLHPTPTRQASANVTNEGKKKTNLVSKIGRNSFFLTGRQKRYRRANTRNAKREREEKERKKKRRKRVGSGSLGRKEERKREGEERETMGAPAPFFLKC